MWGGRQACEQCMEECYRKHGHKMPNKSSYFFKVLMDNFSERLWIPPAFQRHIEHESSENAILKGPNGKIRHVQLIKTIGGMLFDDGWKEFVRDCCLEMEDFLVFRYDGNMQFTVQIFDSTGCEKEDPFSVQNFVSERSLVEIGVTQNLVDYPVLSQLGSHKVTMRKKSREWNVMPLKPLAYDMTDDCDRTKVEETFHHKDDGGFINIDSTTDIQGHLVAFDIDIGSCVPFRTKHRSPNKGKQVGVSKSNMPKNEKLMDSHIGCSEGLNIDPRTSVPFVSNNRLPDKRKFAKVSKTTISSQKKEKPKALHITHSEKLKIKSSSPITYISKDKLPRKNASVLKTKKSPQKKKKSVGSRVRNYSNVVSARRPVTEIERQKAFAAASSFRSGKPFFTHIMKRSNVYSGFYLHIPVWFSRKYFPRRSQHVTLRNPFGAHWVAIYRYKESVSEGALVGGWKYFSIENNLEEGDACVFELSNEGIKEMYVHIFRVVEEIKPLKWAT
ncbi:hypothetical protein AMTRI_Chr07g79330 [Amborella trichopoda]|uniref:TF-B3 domain-containing protein n=1 Tax=Amborella trichopoda TaxID=13333 RepID=W1NV06_AMBTC|nr:B3 domain-containing protein LOC_Os12g40080 [Amborella trichopoda]ERM98499.1 hypothetical protein AMTR_s00072p00182810 [Amborella trichopoda]|eukprot:XP_006833221.1 B3 domain-containing protein LOC_Os12g40080 [Amborella trichopoda]